ncbi:MAG: helix-turn-helix domain-containing protein, partial [Propionibacteriaceae bacterium]|nr:helix-turn-helix domain-containing protein [Propionibacteriaceae bacterium]
MTTTPDSEQEREQVIASLVQGYLDGQSIRALATASGRSYGFVQNALRRAGVTMRTRGVVAPALTTVVVPVGVPD